jgi:hypothetical protein
MEQVERLERELAEARRKDAFYVEQQALATTDAERLHWERLRRLNGILTNGIIVQGLLNASGEGLAGAVERPAAGRPVAA